MRKGLLPAGCWLLAAGCWLLAAGCWLLAAMIVAFAQHESLHPDQLGKGLSKPASGAQCERSCERITTEPNPALLL